MKWYGDYIVTDSAPKKPKKITGTRFGAILGVNPWTTPFNAWCAITRTYEEPFIDTKYTIAGKVIEPKQAEYISDKYFWDYVISPTDVYGEDYFKKTYGDFFPDSKHFGGMWDYLLKDTTGKTEAVLEMKTTKRAEDWVDDIPEYYALQGALYAYLLGVDKVIMVCTILEDKDYDNPEEFIVSKENTFEKEFLVSERYPNFADMIKFSEKWWSDHVKNGKSPRYDVKKDADILKALKQKYVNADEDISTLMAEAEQIQAMLEARAEETKDAEKRLKALKEAIKDYCLSQMGDNDAQVIVEGASCEWTLSKTVKMSVDEKALEADGLLEKYKTKQSVTVRLTTKKKEDKQL